MTAPCAVRIVSAIGLLTLGCNQAFATITVQGDANSYTGADPWSSGTLTVGNTSTGIVSVTFGSDVFSFDGVLGAGPTGSGTVSLFGSGSTWDILRDLVVGQQGTGRLDVESGAVVSNDNATIAEDPLSQGVVNVSGSARWENDGSLDVGFDGSGALNVTGAGYVEAAYIEIGSQHGSSGQALVEGAGSRLVSHDNLVIGSHGNGDLTLRAGGVATVADRTYVRRNPDAVGGLYLDGGVLNTGELYASPGDLHGAGSVNTGGLVSDFDLTFNAASGPTQDLVHTAGGANVAIHVDPNAVGGPYDLGVGYRGAASLEIRDGVVVPSDSGSLGYEPGAVGTAVVSGAGSKWDLYGTVFVGRNGQGSLRTELGGNVDAYSVDIGSFTGASGSATVTGSGSAWDLRGPLSVGSGGAGDLTIEQGASVTAVSALLGTFTTGVATVVVDGVGTSLTLTDALSLGFEGSGEMEIRNGAVVSVANLVGVGLNAASTHPNTLRFDGGVLNAGGVVASPAELPGVGVINTGGLLSDADLVFDADSGLQQTVAFTELPGQQITIHVDATSGTHVMGAGYRGAGSLRIADGVTLQSSFGSVGFHVGSTGEATVTGAGSRWDTGDLGVGENGHGALRVLDGAVVTAPEARSSTGAGSTSEVVVSGPGSRIEGSTLAAFADQGESWLSVTDGGVVSAPTVYLGRRQNGAGHALVSGQESSIEATAGDLWVGAIGSGDLTVLDGALAKAEDEVRIESNFQTPDSFLNLHSGGRLALPGDNDSLLFIFLLDVRGPLGAVRYWDGADWTDIEDATRDVDYTLQYHDTGDLAGYTVLTVGELVALPGDYNADGVVDAADYTVWRDTQGDPSTLPNDIHGGQVGQAQYDTWAAHYGESLSAAAAPEPAAATLAAFVTLLGGWRRRAC